MTNLTPREGYIAGITLQKVNEKYDLELTMKDYLEILEEIEEGEK